MKILHCSDLHGRHLNKISDDVDLVINSGDWMPSSNPLSKEISFQEDWLKTNGQRIKDYLNNKTLLFASGNHDFCDPVPILSKIGVRIINITDHLYIHKDSGLSFYGFPYIPFIYNHWNNERELPEMVKEFDSMIETIKGARLDQIDILVAHCPPYGILDKNREGSSIGNRVLINRIDYCDFSPNYILCGHVHENSGVVSYNYITISNAACTQQILEVPT